MLRKSKEKCFVYDEDTTSEHSLLALCSEDESDVIGEHRELRVSMRELRMSSSLGIRHESFRSFI
jgi:hypothetical protein